MDQNVKFYLPIDKKDASQHMVWGYASTEALDSQGEIVKASAMKAAIADYMKFANVREMHQPKAVGKTKSVSVDDKGTYIGVKVVDQGAWEKVEEGVYNGFSIGGHVKTQVDNIITDLALSEISLVDRPANPEAVFDVWKMDTTEKRDFTSKERKTLASTGKALPDGSFPIVNEADLHNAVRAIGRASNPAEAKAHIMARAKAMGMESALPDDWATNKVDEPEVTKAKKKKENNETELTPDGTPEADSNNTEQDNANEDKDDGAADEGNAPTDDELKAKKKKEEDSTDILKVVDAKVKLGQMPTEDEVEAILKAQELPVTEKTRDLLKYELAGLIIKEVEAQMHAVENADAAKREAKKILNEADVQAADTVAERKQFVKIMELINRTETLIKAGNGYLQFPTKTVANTSNATQNDYEITDPNIPPHDTNANLGTDGNTATSKNLVYLQDVVAILNQKNMGGALSADEINALINGDDSPNNSELTSTGQMSTAPKEGNVVPGKQAGEIVTLQKMEKAFLTKIAALEAQIEKLNKTPMPIAIKTTYTTIEKTENNTEMDLNKAKARAEELNQLMKADPTNQILHQEALLLAPQIMKLQRENK